MNLQYDFLRIKKGTKKFSFLLQEHGSDRPFILVWFGAQALSNLIKKSIKEKGCIENPITDKEPRIY